MGLQVDLDAQGLRDAGGHRLGDCRGGLRAAAADDERLRGKPCAVREAGVGQELPSAASGSYFWMDLRPSWSASGKPGISQV